MSVRTYHQLAPEQVEVVVRGEMPLGVDEYASEKVAAATRTVSRRVTRAVVLVRPRADSARPVKVEVTVDVDGRMVRAEASGARPREAVDELVERLARRLDRLSDRWDRGHVVRDRRRPRPAVSEGALDADVVRRKEHAVGTADVAEAALDMEGLGHDFHLFADAVTGADAVLHVRDDGALGLLRTALPTDGMRDALPADVVDEGLAPTLTEYAARQRLEAGGEPFVAYRDAASGRGAVVYRRHDGRHGVVITA